MTSLLDSLQGSCSSVLQLENYLHANIRSIHDYCASSSYHVLLADKNRIKEFISGNSHILRQLDDKKDTNLTFITLLLDLTERFGMLFEFQVLFAKLQTTPYCIGNRLMASALYMDQIECSTAYVERYDEFLQRLTVAVVEEEDNEKKVLATVINYYAQALRNCGRFESRTVGQLQAKIRESMACSRHEFLRHDLVASVLALDIRDFSGSYNHIHVLLDEFLGIQESRPFERPRFLIESETPYSQLLSRSRATFADIRRISVSEYNKVKTDAIFYSLGRGVRVLKTEHQLFAYMFSYGEMHYAKLESALDHLPVEVFQRETAVIDWACGQGLATMAFLERAESKKCADKVRGVTLVEPSELAIKRASLHISKYKRSILASTINKTFDALSPEEIKDHSQVTKLHFFSNILDVESFSMESLTNTIKKGFRGVNYFICVSPMITGVKTNRIDTFIAQFEGRPGFELLHTSEAGAGAWKKNWTRIVRVFKVCL